MTAGLPGAGLAGLFFILSALLAVPIELVRTVRGRSSRQAWVVVGRHAALALAMILALELAFAAGNATVDQVAGERLEARTLPYLPVLLTFAVLVTVLAATKAQELALRWRRPRAEPVEAPRPLPPPRHSIRSVERRVPTVQPSHRTSTDARTRELEEAGATAPRGG